MNRLKKTLLDTFALSTGQYIGVICYFITLIVVARILGPKLFGIWNSLLVILSFTVLSHLGAVNAISKEVPIQIGKNDVERKRKVQNVSYSIILFNGSIIALALLLFSTLESRDKTYLWGLTCMGFLTITQMLKLLYETVLRSHNHFSTMAKGMVLYNALNAILSIPLTYLLSIYGLYIGITSTNIIILIYYYYNCDEKFSFKLDVKTTKEILKIGFPIYFFGLTVELLNNLGRLLVLLFFDKSSLGYYSISTNFFNLIYLIPQSLMVVLWARLFQKYGEQNSEEVVKPYIFDLSVFMSYTIIPLIVLILFFLKPAIHLLLPKYTESIQSTSILLWSVIFLISPALTSALAILKNEIGKFYMPQLVIILLSFFAGLLVSKFTENISAIALLNLMTYFFYSIFMLNYSFKHFKYSKTDIIKFYIKIYAPLAFSILFFTLSEYFFQLEKYGHVINFLASLIKFTVFFTFYFLIVRYFNKKHEFFSLAKTI